MRYGIPGFRLPKAVLDREIDRLREAGVELRCATEVGRDVAFADLRRD